jgi:hypothetical protein
MSRSKIIICVLIILLCASIFFIATLLNPSLFNSHWAHQQLAKQAANQTDIKIPGLEGDKNLRYSVSFIPPESVQASQDTELHFYITNAQNGNPVTVFKTLYEKPMHMIVVDNELSFFNHIHPTVDGNDFSITTQFPHPGLYRIYLTYQPWNAIEQQVAFTIRVGMDEHGKPQTANHTVDEKLTKTFGEYHVDLDTHGQLNAEKMSLGEQIISATINEAQTNKPIRTLKPYLGAFGHLIMINQSDYSYLHIHPATTTPLKPDATGGPTVDFLPIGIYGKFKPGVYRVFAEFNPDGNLFVADFTVTVD